MLSTKATKMADGTQTANTATTHTASVSNSVQSKASTTSSAPNSQPQTTQTTTSTTSTAAASHVDTKVRNAGASLAEFLTQLEDYTPTVINLIIVPLFTCSCCILVFLNVNFSPSINANINSSDPFLNVWYTYT